MNKKEFRKKVQEVVGEIENGGYICHSLLRSFGHVAYYYFLKEFSSPYGVFAVTAYMRKEDYHLPQECLMNDMDCLELFLVGMFEDFMLKSGLYKEL